MGVQHFLGWDPMRRLIITALACCLLYQPASSNPPPASPYAAERDREIKALSEADIAALRAGQGMGLARAAELNRFPGPMHVLELADRMELTGEQRRQVHDIMERMRTTATTLGAALIEQERNLDRSFAGGAITPDDVTAGTAAIGLLQGRLRAVHLLAHLETRAILTASQIALYQTLRGYDAPAAQAAPHGHHGHSHR